VIVIYLQILRIFWTLGRNTSLNYWMFMALIIMSDGQKGIQLIH